jgi:hypothetical protein
MSRRLSSTAQAVAELIQYWPQCFCSLSSCCTVSCRQCRITGPQTASLSCRQRILGSLADQGALFLGERSKQVENERVAPEPEQFKTLMSGLPEYRGSNATVVIFWPVQLNIPPSGDEGRESDAAVC